jgi:CBS domain-containing protein
MTTVRQVLQAKGGSVWSIRPEATVYEVLELMAAKDIGAVVVVDAQGKLVGIFSERDYARKVVLKGRNSKTVQVGELMTGKVYVVDPDKTLEDCMQLMSTRKIRHLPVLEGDKLVGVISIGDVVLNIISQHEFTIQQLERYITGPSYPGA